MEHRSGLEPDQSGFAVRRLDRFGVRCFKNDNKKVWLGRKDSNLRTLGSEPSAVAAVLLPRHPNPVGRQQHTLADPIGLEPTICFVTGNRGLQLPYGSVILVSRSGFEPEFRVS